MLRAKRAVMTTGEAQPTAESTELRRQELEFYEAIVAVLAAMPRGSTVYDAIASKRASGLVSSGNSSTVARRRCKPTASNPV